MIISDSPRFHTRSLNSCGKSGMFWSIYILTRYVREGSQKNGQSMVFDHNWGGRGSA